MSRRRLRLVLVMGAFRGQQSPFLVFSAAAHIVVIAAAMIWPTLRPRPTMSDAVVEVVMFGPTDRPAATVPAPPKPPPPKPKPEPPAPKPEPDKPAAVQEDPKPKPESEQPEPQDPAPPAPDPEPSSPPTSDEPSPDFDPGLDAETRDSQGGGGVSLEGMGDEFSWYRDAVIRALFTSWRKPFAGTLETLEVAVAFEILRDGGVINVRIERSSGSAPLDRSALRAVHEATLPPLPRNSTAATQPALFVFRLYPEDV